MDEVIFNSINHHTYIGMYTVLDYETSTRMILAERAISQSIQAGQKVIVDLALKVGLTEYRFVEYELTSDGRIVQGSSTNITPETWIIDFANSILRTQEDAIEASFLPKETRDEMLGARR